MVAVLASHFCGTGPGWKLAGELGVRLFFVLSGFLITGILLRCRSAMERTGQPAAFTMRQFYARRALRIFPLFYGTLIVAWLLGVQEVRATLGWHLAYLSNVHFALTDDWHYPLSHFWSLAVEEQFYLVWPALVLLLPRRLLVPSVCAMVAAAPLFRWLAPAMGVRDIAVWTLPFTALDSLGLGSLLALAGARAGGDREGGAAPAPRWLVYGAPAALGVLAVAYAAPASTPALWRLLDAGPLQTLASLVFTAIVLAASRGVTGPLGRLLDFPPLAYLGRISYGVYVIHLFMPELVPWLFARAGHAFPTGAGLTHFVLFTTATVALAALSWHLVERPVNDLKRFFPYEPTARGVERADPVPMPAGGGRATPRALIQQ